ncbi:hypothetical protein [Silanimonas sp.]|jgi:hypothetical protein|uniref:hypothetical protein n=1 Tax=Silanimonas sp. TaxID=1929290 RepID=UPI0022CB1299|nr:hypothetical protein [Silanimonas sp.]MCZ8115812.1 hypothetical protein [Silanimonas sp.]
MMPSSGLRWRGAWLAVWVFGWGLCLVLSLGPPVPGAAPLFPHADKLNHAVAYAALAWWAMGCFASTTGRRRALLALLVLGAAMEWAQGAFTVDRQRDGLDLVANAVGVGLGTALGLALNLPAWLEARFRR